MYVAVAHGWDDKTGCTLLNFHGNTKYVFWNGLWSVNPDMPGDLKEAFNIADVNSRVSKLPAVCETIPVILLLSPFTTEIPWWRITRVSNVNDQVVQVNHRMQLENFEGYGACSSTKGK